MFYCICLFYFQYVLNAQIKNSLSVMADFFGLTAIKTKNETKTEENSQVYNCDEFYFRILVKFVLLMFQTSWKL